MSRRGFTVVEVMMALAVLTLGATGVIAMQKATLISNTNARNLVTATSIAQSWMERLRVDALAWNEPNHTSDFLTETQWLKKATAAGTTAWFYPDMVAPGVTTQPLGSPSFDVMGADRWDNDPTASAFCTQIRLTRFQNLPLANGDLPPYYRVVRVEVRVFWDRLGNPIDCTVAVPADFDAQVGHSVYLVSAVLENAAPDL